MQIRTHIHPRKRVLRCRLPHALSQGEGAGGQAGVGSPCGHKHSKEAAQGRGGGRVEEMNGSDQERRGTSEEQACPCHKNVLNC